MGAPTSSSRTRTNTGARDGRRNADLRALPRGGGRGIEALQKAHAPLICYLDAERTTPQKKKDRLAALATVCKANAV